MVGASGHLTALPHPLMAYAGGDNSGLGRGLDRCTLGVLGELYLGPARQLGYSAL